ncbi:MAG TPA: hypothetical protein VGA78_14920 [Gemmatimonadales bacterium]|jgi:hypothetical protein
MRHGLLVLTAGALLAARPVGAQETGALLLQGGLTAPLDPSEGPRAGFNTSLTFVVGRFALGPEIGWYFTAGRELSPSSRPENTVTTGGVARYDLAGRGWRPYLTGGMALQFWESARGGYPTENAFDVSGGVGLRQVPSRSPIGLAAEFRIHTSLQSADLDGRTFLTATVGLGWRW